MSVKLLFTWTALEDPLFRRVELAREEKDWQRRPPRHKTKLVAAGRRNGGNAFRICVTDISYDGCQIVSDEPLSVGDPIIVIVPRMGEMRARVEWVDENRVGLSFLLEERTLNQGTPMRPTCDDR